MCLVYYIVIWIRLLLLIDVYQFSTFIPCICYILKIILFYCVLCRYRGHWATDWSPTWLCGHGLNKSTVGVVGLGRIGLSVARKLKQFNISKLLYTSRKEKPEG